MRRAKRVIRGLRAFREPADPPALPQTVHLRTAPSQNLVRIALVTHVPDQLVARRVKHRVDRHTQFHHTKAGAQMPTRLAYGADHLTAQLGRKPRQLRIGHLSQIRRAGNSV